MTSIDTGQNEMHNRSVAEEGDVEVMTKLMYNYIGCMDIFNAR